MSEGRIALPLDRVLALTHGRCVPSRSAFAATVDLSTDTRCIRPGQIYVALSGERFDGHAFVEQARAHGAAGAVVVREAALPSNFPGIVVADTTQAYLACAQAARELYTGQVAAITGSVGKTTTKAFCAALCEAASLGPVLATPANENNEIGVGHLLLRALRDAMTPRTLIVEMGARHSGEIEVLCRAARPTVGILTGVGESHLENFPSLESLEETKWGLFATGARPVLSGSDRASLARLSRVLDRAPLLCYAEAPVQRSDPRAGEVCVSAAGEGIVEASYRAPGTAESHTYRTAFPIPGAHHRLDVALALGAVAALGGNLDHAIAALGTLSLPEGRYQAIELPNGANVVYDAYNAAPSSTEAALQTFAARRARRRIAVLASMAELGPDAEELHRRVGACAGALTRRRMLDALLVGGEFSGALEEGAIAGGAPRASITRFASNADATEWLRGHLHPGDAVLLKGSRRYKMEEILEGLRR
ncbi:UDP-N-acetylmuramoyl-tripeptide--D-alanyl-D-alanine ligase [bacterium]|nr:MAG: UDP-N-acetylmuramoyl-tripeptide--D-alanyl-D-alanine ligase [bacterium]